MGRSFNRCAFVFGAFVIRLHEVWSEYNISARAVSREGGALHDAVVLASALPKGIGRPIGKTVANYGSTVAQVEWPAMKLGQRSPQAAKAFQIVLDSAVDLVPERPAERAIQSQIVSLLADAHAARETRTFQMTLGVPTMVWLVLTAMALILDGCLLFAGSEMRSHIFLSAAASASTAAALVMVRMLDFPFEGSPALSSSDFIKMTSEVASLLTSR